MQQADGKDSVSPVFRDSLGGARVPQLEDGSAQFIIREINAIGNGSGAGAGWIMKRVAANHASFPDGAWIADHESGRDFAE